MERLTRPRDRGDHGLAAVIQHRTLQAGVEVTPQRLRLCFEMSAPLREGCIVARASEPPPHAAEIPEEIVKEMEKAVDGLTPAEIVGMLASIPLAQQTHELLRAIAFRAAEQRLLEHVVSHAEYPYGGN